MKLSSKVFRLVFITFVSLTLISNVISLYFVQSLYSKEILNNLDNVMTQQKRNVDYRLIRLYELLIYPSYSDNIIETILNTDPAQLDAAEKNELKNQMEDYFLLNIYIPARTYFYTATFNIVIDESYPVSELFLSESQNVVSSKIFKDTINYSSDIRSYRSPRDDSFLTFSRGIVYRQEPGTSSPVYIGSVYITIHYSDLTDSLQNFTNNEEQSFYLISPDMDIFGVREDFSDDTIRAALEKMDDYEYDYYRLKSFSLKQGSSEYLVQVIELNTNWMIMHVLNYDQINRDTFPIVLVVAITTLVMAFFIFLLSHRLIPKIICSPITNLSDSMQSIIASKNYDQEISTKDPCLEISTLYSSFNRLLKHITSQIEELNESNQKKQEAELKVLQKLINPHFLYNTLDSIGFSVMNSYPEIAKSISTLSDLLRYATYEPYKMVTLASEIDNIRKYIEIQNFCYSMDIRLYVKTKHADSFYLPKLTLQPLVENAIQHGIRECANEHLRPFIRFSTVLQDDGLILLLENNGKDPDISAIEEILGSENPTSKLGVYNVNARLVMQFGEKAKLQYSKRKGGGTVIRICIPC